TLSQTTLVAPPANRLHPPRPVECRLATLAADRREWGAAAVLLRFPHLLLEERPLLKRSLEQGRISPSQRVLRALWVFQTSSCPLRKTAKRGRWSVRKKVMSSWIAVRLCSCGSISKKPVLTWENGKTNPAAKFRSLPRSHMFFPRNSRHFSARSLLSSRRRICRTQLRERSPCGSTQGSLASRKTWTSS